MSAMRWRMRCVTPRDESSRTLCLFFFTLRSATAVSSPATGPARSSTSISSARRLPLPFTSFAFAFCAFNIDAIPCSFLSVK